MNLWDDFRKTADRFAGRKALVDGEREFTFSEVRTGAEKLAAAVGRGTEKRAAGLFLPTGPEFVMGFYALWRAGLTAIPLNIQAPKRVLDFMTKALKRLSIRT